MYGSVAAFACLETNAWSSNGSCSFHHIAHRGVEPKAVCCKQFIRSLASQKCSLRSEAVTLRTQTLLTILTNPLPLIRVYIHIYDSLRRKKRKQVPGIIQECILNDICRPYANKQTNNSLATASAAFLCLQQQYQLLQQQLQAEK